MNFAEFFKNTFFTEHLLAIVAEYGNEKLLSVIKGTLIQI